MSGEVTIQWCPSCKGWGHAHCLESNVFDGHTWIKPINLITFSYRKDRLQCRDCGETFEKTKIRDCEPRHRWHAEASLGGAKLVLAA